MWPWEWWTCWVRIGTEIAFAPFVEAGTGVYPSRDQGPSDAQVEYLMAELYADIESAGVRGIIDEGGLR